jgi:hypothetical protein
LLSRSYWARSLASNKMIEWMERIEKEVVMAASKVLSQNWDNPGRRTGVLLLVVLDCSKLLRPWASVRVGTAVVLRSDPDQATGKCWDSTSIRPWLVPYKSFPIHLSSSDESTLCFLATHSVAK